MQADKSDVLRRLATIEGHLRGIRKMVEEDAYCVDILRQTRAVKGALDRLDQTLLRRHLAICVPDGIKNGREEQVLRELEDLFGLTAQ
ncbi:MAG: metal-sensitive transcriptional regulator [Chloroflexi bacterium]|jgi:DNA-binding FrmR family transcriptional regulator|nr:metal-sensitive transcriptional regulator [Chloroflexota bacterium]HLG51874.1 metal-sensitive transcriptional regulator [Chloroflexota bacterium]